MLIEDQSTFDRLVSTLQNQKEFCLDTEFISERSFRPRLCLLQIAYADTIVAVDPFTVKDLGAFLDLLLDPAIEKILHAGQQDMRIFYDLMGRPPENIFDTQIAAALLGHGDSIGYARLVEACVKVRLRRDEAFTDWSRRPLTPHQVEYALDDVRYLQRMRQKLGQELKERGRASWLQEELSVYSDINYFRRDPETLYGRFRTAGNLSAMELSVLQELALWREKEAESRDRPRTSIVSDEVLVDLARRRPRSLGALENLRGLRPRLVKRSGEDILQRIRKGENQPPETFPVVPKSPPKNPETTLLVDLLEVLLKVRAAELKISPRQIATRSQLYQLIQSFDKARDSIDLRVLKGWRGELVGRELINLLRGVSTIGVDPGTGRVVVRPR